MHAECVFIWVISIQMRIYIRLLFERVCVWWISCCDSPLSSRVRRRREKGLVRLARSCSPISPFPFVWWLYDSYICFILTAKRLCGAGYIVQRGYIYLAPALVDMAKNAIASTHTHTPPVICLLDFYSAFYQQTQRVCVRVWKELRRRRRRCDADDDLWAVAAAQWPKKFYVLCAELLVPGLCVCSVRVSGVSV